MPHFAVCRLATGLVVSLAASTALASPREDLVKSFLEQSAFGLPVEIGASAYDPSTQSVVLENVTVGGLQNGLVRFTYPSLTVEDPRRTPEGLFAAHAIHFVEPKIEIKLDMKAWFPDFAKLGESAPAPAGDAAANGAAPDAAAPAEPPAAVPLLVVTADTGLYERPVLPFGSPTMAGDAGSIQRIIAAGRWLQGARIDWSEYNNVKYTVTGLPDGAQTETEYGLIYASGLHDGRIERSGASDMKQTNRTADGTEQTVTVGNTYAVGSDFKAYLDAFDPAAYGDGKGDGRWRTVVADAGYNDLKMEIDGGTLTASNIDVKGFRVRQTPKPALAAVTDLLASPDASKEDPFAFASSFLPNITGLYGVDAVTMADFDVEAPGDVSVKLGSLELDQIDADGLAAFTLRKIDVRAGGEGAGSGTLDLFTVNDVKFGDLASWMSLGKVASDGGTPDSKQIQDAMLNGSPTVSFMELAGLNVETPQGAIGLDSFAMTESDWFKALAQRYDLTFTRASMPVAMVEDPAAKAQLTAMGYDRIVVSGGSTLTWNVQSGDVRAEDVTVKVEDMGRLSMDLHLGNLPLSAFFDNPDQIEQRLQEGTLVDGSVTFGDAGLVEKAFEVQAKQMNQDPAMFRQNFAAAMPLMLGFLDDKRIQDKFAAVLKTFFETPQSISLSVKPAAPLPFSILDQMQAEAPGTILDLLKVDVVANQ